MKRYGPRGKAGLVSGMAKALPRTSSSVIGVSGIDGELVHHESRIGGRRREPAGLFDRALRVAQALLPAPLERAAREIDVLRRHAPVAPRVGQPHDVHGGIAAHFAELA